MVRRIGAPVVSACVLGAALGMPSSLLAQDTYQPSIKAMPERAQPKDDSRKDAKQDAKKHDYAVEGQYVEACSCRAPCACELTGDVMKSCQGVGAVDISKGTYNGVDLSGAKIAYALGVGEWVDVYVDAKSPQQAEATKALARAALKDFGPIQAVKDAKIDLTRAGYAYTVKVDGGKTMAFTTEPVMGRDGKTPLAHENIPHNAFNSTLLQGKSVTCSYHGEGKKEFSVDKGRNAYFNDKMKFKGEI